MNDRPIALLYPPLMWRLFCPTH